MTTALTPNTKVIVPGFGPNAWDMETTDESDGGPIYVALTSDSFHPGGVNILLGDGSVRFVRDSINGATWRALGTIAGGEIISADSYRAGHRSSFHELLTESLENAKSTPRGR